MENSMKDLFQKEKYDEVIDLIKVEYSILFKNMLDYKEKEYEQNYGFEVLSAEIMKYYPQYFDMIVRVKNSLMQPEDTYFDVINTMLSVYDNISKNYMDDGNYEDGEWDIDFE